MINEFLASGSVDRVQIGIDRTGERYLRSRSGINYPYIFPDAKEIFDKVPTIEIPNVGTIDGGPYPSSSAGPIYQISNNVTKIPGNHTFKAGVLWERSGQNDFDQINVSGVPGGTNNQNGRFIFQDTRSGASSTGTGLANAALGLFSAYAEIGPRAYTPYRSHMAEFFVQDSWRVNEKFKLELGIRGTWQNGYYKSLWGNIAIFDPKKYDSSKAAVIDRATGYVLSGNRYNGVVIPGSSFPDAGKGRVPAIDSGQYNNLLDGGSAYPSQNQYNLMPRLGVGLLGHRQGRHPHGLSAASSPAPAFMTASSSAAIRRGSRWSPSPTASATTRAAAAQASVPAVLHDHRSGLQDSARLQLERHLSAPAHLRHHRRSRLHRSPTGN